MTVFLLSNTIDFPPPGMAEKEGLLAVGGDLSVKRLLLAYRMGIFPWYSEDEPIMWWSPDPRLVLYPAEIRISRSLKKLLAKDRFTTTMDTCFEDVITACAHVRTGLNQETWIGDDMIVAYCRLHAAGYAHSVETWEDGVLVGGLYGISLGRCFFGESMFSTVSNASKVAFVRLVEFLMDQAFTLVDCQVTTGHLKRFGAREIPRADFLEQLTVSLGAPNLTGPWGQRE